MKTTRTSNVFSQDELEKDLEKLAPRVRQAFAQVGEPSVQTLSAIHNEAVAYSAQRSRRRHFIPLFRALAAAAVLALILGGAVQVHLTRLEGANIRQVGHLLNLGSSHVPSGQAEESAELATRLLRLQGLDEETLSLTSEEPEVLWL